jgi:hypothetical protein
MRPSPKHLLGRAREKARQSAAGTPSPAGQAPPAGEEQAPPRAGAGERVGMRRRMRRLRRTREVLLRDLGALLVEMHRRERQNPELLKRKAAEIAALESELHGLRAALDEDLPVERVVAAGVAGRCATCGTLTGIDDRFCANCGSPARPPAAKPPPPPPPPPAPPAGEPELTAGAPPKE